MWTRLLGMGLVMSLIVGLVGSGTPEGMAEGGDRGKGKVETGLDRILKMPHRLKGKKVGLITNPTGMTADYRHGLDAMLEKGIQVTKVYGPEHGVRGTEQAGDLPGSFIDPRTGLPFINLYGMEPDEMVPLFEDVDVIIFDIQDVGTRFYTYIYTMAYAMEASAEAGKPFIVLDRPNPLGGETVTGPILDPSFRSFVGLYPIPLVHGMTIGELAQLFNNEFISRGGKAAQLEVITMKGWNRTLHYTDSGVPWVLPSPNMPTPDTANVYPGTGLIEGTNLSEGRGTTRPFELIGAPYIEGWRLAEALNEANLPCVSFREAYFNPTFSKYKGETVGGIQLYVEDPQCFSPVLTGLTIIQKTRELYPDQFAWRKDGDSYWIDKLTGTDQVRRQLDQGRSPKEIMQSWQAEEKSFKKLRRRYLLYPPLGKGK